MKDTINTCILNSMKLNELLLNDSNIHSTLINIVDLIVNSYKKSNKVLLCGNGGSAADAQHIAAELSGRFYKDRGPLYAEALHVNSSFVTAVANDYGFQYIFSRQIESIGVRGDIAFGFSTSQPRLFKPSHKTSLLILYSSQTSFTKSSPLFKASIPAT